MGKLRHRNVKKFAQDHMINMFLKLGFIYLFFNFDFREKVCEQGRGAKGDSKRIPNRLHTQSRAWRVAHHGAQSHHQEVNTSMEIKSWRLNQLSHPGAPEIGC